jgi:hypothetical protein
LRGFWEMIFPTRPIVDACMCSSGALSSCSSGLDRGPGKITETIGRTQRSHGSTKGESFTTSFLIIIFRRSFYCQSMSKQGLTALLFFAFCFSYTYQDALA